MSPYVGQRVKLAAGFWGEDLVGMLGTIVEVFDKHLTVKWDKFRLANGMRFEEVEAM